jgi:protein tyrosine/serine phosphatase
MRNYSFLAAIAFAAACGGQLPPDNAIKTGPAQGEAVDASNVNTPPIELVDNNIYRGPRPTYDTLVQLQSMGVTTIVDLENTQSAIDQEQQWAQQLGLNFISEPMSGFWTPDDSEVDQIESIIADPSQGPMFVHCQHGQDRTGLIIGLYRVFNEGWDPGTAHQEMVDKGFHTLLWFLNHYYEDKTGWDD